MISSDTLKSLFENQVATNPVETAVLFGKKSITYEELNNKANQLAHYLLELGLKPETPVAVGMERSIDLLIVLIAIVKAGGVYLPLDPSQPQERLFFILNDCKPPILLTSSNFKKTFPPSSAVGSIGKIIFYDKSTKKLNKYPIHNPSHALSPQQLAYIIYTSGSTGTPKGVLIEHASVINYCKLFTEAQMTISQRRIDFSSNNIFDMAITNTIVALMLGLVIVICDDATKKEPNKYLNYLKEFQINLIKLTPSYFKVLLQQVKNNYIRLPNLESIILGGENLTSIDCKSWLTLFPKQSLYNEYGPTEATVGIANYKISTSNVDKLETNVPIGKPGSNIYCYILDDHHKQVKPGDIGELYIGGACLARAYLNQNELTLRLFIQDPFSKTPNARLYKTGDLCKINEDGLIEYLGRIDNQVKIRGYRIEPGELEQHLKAYPAIDTAVVIDQKDSLNETCLVAYYTLKDTEQAPNANQLRSYMLNHLPEYMIPTAFVRIDAIPLTANGKLDRSKLTMPLLTSSQAYKKPRTKVQKMLADIWSEELGVPSIGLNDNFFELGGHSLSAARIISKINNVLDKDLSLFEFYKTTSLGQLANLIKKTKSKKRRKVSFNNQKYKNKKEIPLSDFQFLLWMSNIFESKAKKLNITARKRFKGRMDPEALSFAFKALFKTQEVLTYHILSLRPLQQLKTKWSFTIPLTYLDTLPEEDYEIALQASMNELIAFHSWGKNAPLIKARLFFLKDDISELQLCIAHSISDDLSPEILFFELSKFYLAYNHGHHFLSQEGAPNLGMKKTIANLKPNKGFRDYVLNERHDFERNLQKDVKFWGEYLKETSFFSFPSEQIIKNMGAKNQAYSTYIKIPETKLNHLKQYCATHHLSLNDGLTAVLSLALFNTCEYDKTKTQSLFINIVKSTRDNPIYDDTVGCFLRLEPVKVDLNKQSSLETITKQIHQSTIETIPYQDCSNLVKLTSTKTLRQKRNPIKIALIYLFTTMYSVLFRIPKIYRRIFTICGGRLMSFKRDNHFLVTINVHNNFHKDRTMNAANLFGLNSLIIKHNPQDLLKIENVFEVSFLRNEEQVPYMVLSANLKPDFRELIGKEVLRILGQKILIT